LPVSARTPAQRHRGRSKGLNRLSGAPAPGACQADSFSAKPLSAMGPLAIPTTLDSSLLARLEDHKGPTDLGSVAWQNGQAESYPGTWKPGLTQ
jgi:hypothetical protein